MSATQRLALLGAGAMGGTLLTGLVKAGWATDHLCATDARAERRAELGDTLGVTMLASNADAVTGADLVVLVVKPHDATAVLDEIADHLTPGALVASLCAGVSTATVEAHLPEGTPVVRIMPNTPARVGQGMAAISPGRHATDAHLARATELMQAVGRAVVVPEKQQDAVTAVSGSGPAYVFHVAEAMIEAGVQLGLPRDIATELVTQTLLGSATLLRESGTHPSLLREQVTSPGGTTAAALRELDAHGVRAAFADALRAAADRSAELGG